MSSFNVLHEWSNAQHEIVDPGASGVLPVSKTGIVNMTSATVETRTLARPAKTGIQLTLMLYSDGGDITVTVTGDVGALTFADEGDWVTLHAVEDTTALNWAVLGSKIASTPAFLPLPIYAFSEDDGTALAVFSGGASTTPGWSATAEGGGIRWNNHANPDPVRTTIPYPPDLDATANVIVHFLAYKTGATSGDAVTWTCTAFENIDAALFDADADFGGASSAMTGNAATKTVQEETLTLALANVTGSPGCITFSIQPTDGTLGTDDVTLLAVWLEYTRKILAS
tara:strand:+ start:967 stop:1818 length:852 start_codon:yes stop_codon:yes gene_type:complete